LATVHADTAGSLVAAARYRDLAEAWAMAADLTERARAARHAPSPGQPRSWYEGVAPATDPYQGPQAEPR
jgi:hypothetical protein